MLSFAEPTSIGIWLGMTLTPFCECTPKVLARAEDGVALSSIMIASMPGSERGVERVWRQLLRAAPFRIPLITRLLRSRKGSSWDQLTKTLRWKVLPATSFFWETLTGKSAALKLDV